MSWIKETTKRFILIALVVLTIEAISALFYFSVEKPERFEETEQRYHPNSIIHPYTGYVKTSYENYLENQFVTQVGGDGFLCGGAAICYGEKTKFADIAILGGSVAVQVCDAFAIMYPDKVVKCLAIEGGKQPQQATVLAYHVSLGWKFDYVVNVDGNNEIGDGIRANLNYSTFPAYPFAWHERINSFVPINSSNLRDAIFFLKLRDEINNYEESRSYFISILARLTMLLLDKQISMKAFAPPQDYKIQGDTMRHGPLFSNEINDYKEFTLQLWVNSSLVIESITKEIGARYIHVLQPVQYIDGAKNKFTEFEIANTLNNPVNKPLLNEMYPRFRKIGFLKLSAFHDFSFIFKDVEETVFLDNCCHVNSLGKRIITQRIADLLDLP